MKILTLEADGVRVDIKFDPDDPAARVAWLAKLDQYRQAFHAYHHLEPRHSDPAAEAAWRTDDRERERKLDQKAKELDDIISRAATHNRGAP